MSAKELKEKYYELISTHRKERVDFVEKQSKAEREAWEEYRKKANEENESGKARYKF